MYKLFSSLLGLTKLQADEIIRMVDREWRMSEDVDEFSKRVFSRSSAMAYPGIFFAGYCVGRYIAHNEQTQKREAMQQISALFGAGGFVVVTSENQKDGRFCDGEPEEDRDQRRIITDEKIPPSDDNFMNPKSRHFDPDHAAHDPDNHQVNPIIDAEEFDPPGSDDYQNARR